VITRLVNTCGVDVVMQLVVTAEPIGAVGALRCNLVNEVVPADRLMHEALLMARQVQRNS
jgi:enoyl-CoA hydratase/carnithine racemase